MTALISSAVGFGSQVSRRANTGTWWRSAAPKSTHQPTLPQMTQIQRFDGLWQVEHLDSLVSDVIVLRRWRALVDRQTGHLGTIRRIGEKSLPSQPHPLPGRAMAQSWTDLESPHLSRHWQW